MRMMTWLGMLCWLSLMSSNGTSSLSAGGSKQLHDERVYRECFLHVTWQLTRMALKLYTIFEHTAVNARQQLADRGWQQSCDLYNVAQSLCAILLHTYIRTALVAASALYAGKRQISSTSHSCMPCI